jgi:WD40 repeat protein
MRMWQRTTGVQGAERIFVRRGCRWLGVWLAWVSVLSAFGQGRPDIVWMQGGHALSITGVAYSSNAYSPNGDFIVSGSFDRTIKVWRVSDGALIRTLTGHIDYIHCVALSPDGTLIAFGGATERFGCGACPMARWYARSRGTLEMSTASSSRLLAICSCRGATTEPSACGASRTGSSSVP